MQKVATRPHARQMPHGQAASFSIYGSILYKNRQALPVRDTGSRERPAHSVFYSILLFILRNNCAIVKGERRPAGSFYAKKQGGIRCGAPSLFYFIPDTSCAGASDAPGSGRIPFPDSFLHCHILRGWCAAQRAQSPGLPRRKSASA